MHEILQKVSAMGIVPTIKIDNAEHALPLAKALCAGGLPCAEVTFRTAAAADAIRNITTGLPEMLVGAGTVLTTEQADKAIEAGARFIVSPGLNPVVVKHCQQRGVPVVPGCATPSDIEAAMGLGLEVVKFFPAEAAGGLAMIKAMAAPYHQMKFMPTGGIHADNLNEYLSFSKVVACGGSWMVTDKLINEGRFDEITALTRQAVQKMLGFSLAHVGINAEAGEAALGIAQLFANAFGFAAKEGNSSVFAGSVVEVMKTPGLGKMGHIAIGTNYIHRAVSYLEAQGYTFNPESAKHDANGKLLAIYLTQDFGGFAVHLVQKK